MNKIIQVLIVLVLASAIAATLVIAMPITFKVVILTVLSSITVYMGEFWR